MASIKWIWFWVLSIILDMCSNDYLNYWADEQFNNTASTSVAMEMNALSYLFIELIHKA